MKLGIVGRSLVDRAGIDHRVEDDRCPRFCAIEVLEGRKLRRGLDQSG